MVSPRTIGHPRRRRPSLVYQGVALLCVTAFFLIDYNIYKQSWTFFYRIPFELIFLISCSLFAAVTPAFRHVFQGLAATFLTLAALIHGIELLSRSVYGRGLDLVFDLAQVPNVLDLLAQSMSWFLVAPLTFLACLVFLGVATVSTLLGIRLVDLINPRRVPPLTSLLSCVVLLCTTTPDLFGAYSHKTGKEGGGIEKPASPLFMRFASWMAGERHFRIAQAWVDGGASVEAMYLEQRGEVRDGVTTLPGFEKSDIYLIFIESYGASLFARPAHKAHLRALYQDYEPGFIKTGRAPVSTLVQSPTYGGLSWLAHLSTLAGAWIDENLEYRVFLQSAFDTLPKILSRTGYESHLFMPGIRGFWPEGVLLGFDHVYEAKDMGYGGVEFGYFAIPDQYTLERAAKILEKRKEASDGLPLFTQITLITSHYPFRPLPPRIQDPSMILNDAVWAVEAENAGSFEVEDWDKPEDGYIAGVSYSLRAALDFATRHTDADDLVIILGDHQPWTFVSGGLGGRSSPIHVITGNDRIKRCFVSDGYRPGLLPNRDTALYGMDWILQRLTAHFGDRATHSTPNGCAPPLGS